MAENGRKSDTTVQAFIAELDHPLKPAIAALREVLLGADVGIAEEIKWNAPSFRTSEHFATMHLRARDSLQLILHLGARSKRVVPRDAIEDPHGLLKWLGPGRASVTIASQEDLQRKKAPLVAIVQQWITHV